MLPYTLNFFDTLNLPIPFDESGVKPVCLNLILNPVFWKLRFKSCVNAFQLPSLILYCISFPSKLIVQFSSNVSIVKYCSS